MAWRSNQGRAINDSAVGSDLARQAIEGIGIGLDLYAADVAVYDRYINAAGAMVEAKLIDDDRVGTRTRTR
jgi:hypothetical protein